MTVSHPLSVGVLLLLTVSMPALAYQYAGYAPYPPAVPQYAYTPYTQAPAPYYPAHRYPSQPLPVPRSMRTGYMQPGYAYTRQPAAGHAAENNTAPATAVHTTATANNEPRSINNSAVDSGTAAGGKKQRFMETLLPVIEEENQRLSQLRTEVIRLLARIDSSAPGQSEQQRLQTLAETYRVAGDPVTSKSARDELLRKIDIIPSSLALAQAATESGWGKSKFALEANNLYGIRTHDESKGLKPGKRAQGKTHLVRVFDDVRDSVRYYMHTLNSNPAYATLREIRQQLRTDRQIIDGHELATGLEKYSAQGQQYIDLIQSLIRQNEWARLDKGDQQA